MSSTKYNGQALQDKFVLSVLNMKNNGFFLEIGSSHPIQINNTYILETNYNWKGIMVEFDPRFLLLYNQCRPNSHYIIKDATQIDYLTELQTNNAPYDCDYLQIDLEVSNGVTLKTLQILEQTIFNNYKFATVTFEHDIYTSNYNNTRIESRNIFKRNGYVCVFEDVANSGNAYEDWYVYPNLVDMNYVNNIKTLNRQNYKPNSITGSSIDWNNIVYL